MDTHTYHIFLFPRCLLKGPKGNDTDTQQHCQWTSRVQILAYRVILYQNKPELFEEITYCRTQAGRVQDKPRTSCGKKWGSAPRTTRARQKEKESA